MSWDCPRCMVTFEESPQENAELVKALRDMRFAYVNKDEDMPHGFEIEAMKECERLIGSWPQPMAEMWNEAEWKWNTLAEQGKQSCPACVGYGKVSADDATRPISRGGVDCHVCGGSTVSTGKPGE